MGLSSSKIPPPKPGQLLLCIGLSEYDEFYKELEVPIKTIDELRSELDLRTTELIKSISASNIWEHNPSMENIFRMIFTVLVSIGKGNLSSIASFSQSSPFIVLSPNLPFKKVKKTVESFRIFMDTVYKIEKVLGNCKISEEKVKFSEEIQENIAKKVIENEYSMGDKLDVLKIVNENHQHISKTPEVYEEMMKIYYEVPRMFKKVVDESKIPPFSEILMQRGVQAASENLKNPSSIIKKFWPII